MSKTYTIPATELVKGDRLFIGDDFTPFLVKSVGKSPGKRSVCVFVHRHGSNPRMKSYHQRTKALNLAPADLVMVQRDREPSYEAGDMVFCGNDTMGTEWCTAGEVRRVNRDGYGGWIYNVATDDGGYSMFAEEELGFMETQTAANLIASLEEMLER